MTLFNEHPDRMTGKKALEPRESKVLRNDAWQELFQAAEAAFYPSGIADGQRAQVAKLVDDLLQKGATAAEFKRRHERYGELFPRTVCTLPAMLNQWDTCAAPGPRTQPGMPSTAEQMADRYSEQIHRRQCEQEQAERDKARVIVQEAPGGVADALLKEWLALPCNSYSYLAERSWSPTDRCCVRWIAAKLEARNA